MNLNQIDNKYYDDEKTISYFNMLHSRANHQVINAMGSIIIIDRERKVKVVELKSDTMTIGRLGDIPVVSKIIARNQGKFFKKNGEYYYMDVGSTNGSELNGVQICNPIGSASNEYCLGDGDVIRIMVPGDTNNIENVLIVFSKQSSSNLRWQYIDLRRNNGALQIGRNVQGYALRIDSMQVSKLHASILKTENNYVIVDEHSLNGIVVNGKQIEGRYILSDFDVISIGSTKIIYLDNYIIFNVVPKGVKLEVQNISKVVHGVNHPILNDVTLTINPCELVAIIGGSGAGKTTFVNCINGYEPATKGTVLFDGVDLIKNYKQLKSRIGNVPQSDELYDYLTVYDFLIFTAKLRLSKDISLQERNNRVNTVIDIMGLKEHQRKPIKKLSGGQKKRVSIAMELVSDPDIFFLDEPTSGLDPETETLLMKQLKILSVDYNKTVIVITHTLQNIHLFDKIIFLAPGGKLCYYGTPAEALSYFDIQSIPEAYEKVKNNVEYFVNKYQRYSKGGLS